MMWQLVLEILRAPLESRVILGITIAIFIVDAIRTFDLRLTQAKRAGNIPHDEPSPGSWVNAFYWLYIILFIVLLILDWRYAILFWLVLFVLRVLPVLETIGNILMSPFRPRGRGRHRR
jgi:hypothetical protein